MDPAVVAAIIAAGVSLLTLIFSVWAQNRSSGDNTKTLEAQREQLQGAFQAQSDQLKSTLEAQTDQLKSTLDQERDRTLNERFATAADRLGDDKPSAVRLAGVYAMAGLADDWSENRQTCVDVLCAYLRLPHDPDPSDKAPPADRAAYRANREVRHTVIRVIGAHLRAGAPMSWQGLNFDFTGVVFDGGDFAGARFSGGTVSFDGAEFPGGLVHFHNAKFSGAEVNFRNAKFSGAAVFFSSAEFSGGEVRFGEAEFSGGLVHFGDAKFSGSTVNFPGAKFSGAEVSFALAEFSGVVNRLRRSGLIAYQVFGAGPLDVVLMPGLPTSTVVGEAGDLPDRIGDECGLVAHTNEAFIKPGTLQLRNAFDSCRRMPWTLHSSHEDRPRPCGVSGSLPRRS